MAGHPTWAAQQRGCRMRLASRPTPHSATSGGAAPRPHTRQPHAPCRSANGPAHRRHHHPPRPPLATMPLPPPPKKRTRVVIAVRRRVAGGKKLGVHRRKPAQRRCRSATMTPPVVAVDVGQRLAELDATPHLPTPPSSSFAPTTLSLVAHGCRGGADGVCSTATVPRSLSLPHRRRRGRVVDPPGAPPRAPDHFLKRYNKWPNEGGPIFRNSST